MSKEITIGAVLVAVALVGLPLAYKAKQWIATDERSEPKVGDAPTPDPILVGHGESKAGEERTFAGIGFVWCPAGTFMMGAPANEQDSDDPEKPQHQVTLTRGFWMSKYEVTQAQWRAVTDNSPSHFQGGKANGANTDSRPVENVSWDEITGARGFLARLNAANPGLGFRLPSEAEWEYASRAGTTTRFYWGDDPDYSQVGFYAWYYDNSDKQTHDVGTNRPNAWGLYDMSGNVWEWCQDWVGPYEAGAVSDPQGVKSGTYRVLRGGSWDLYAKFSRATARFILSGPGAAPRSYHVGLRLVRTP